MQATSMSSWEQHLTPCMIALKGRHGSGYKDNFDSGQNKIKACSYTLKDRECNPLFVTLNTSCKLYFKRENILQLHTSNSFVDFQLPRPPITTELHKLLV